jgi:hypothetical protein
MGALVFKPMASALVPLICFALSCLPAMASSSARDAVLFVDVNHSPHEITAAREAARKSGREFVLYPPDDGRSRQAFDRQKQELRRITIAASRRGCDSLNPPRECAPLNAQRAAIVDRLDEARAKLAVSKEGLHSFIAQQVAENRVFSTMVVSGHDGTGKFSGEFGEIGDVDLADILDDHPSLKEGLRALHLWGCYTTSPGSLMLNWKRHFPNVLAISGYDLKAPLNNAPSGWTYLSGIIEREPRLFEMRDANALRRLLREIPGATNMHAAVMACGLFANNNEAYSIADMVQRCQGFKTTLEQREPRIRCFERGEAACSNLPEPPGRGEIREFYNFLQNASACSTFLPDETIFQRFDRDRILRLIFGKVVQGNFAQQYATELRESNTFLRELGADAGLRLDNLASLSRRDLIRTIEDLGNFVNDGLRAYGTDPRTVQADMNMGRLVALRKLHRSLLGHLVNFDPHCVPMTWLDPNSRNPSDCLDREEIGQRSLAKFANRLAENPRLQGQIAIRGFFASTLDASKEDDENAPPLVRESRSSYLRAELNRLDRYIWDAQGDRRLTPERARQLDLAVERAQSGFNQATNSPSTAVLPSESLDWPLLQAGAEADLVEAKEQLNALRERIVREQGQTNRGIYDLIIKEDEERIKIGEARLRLTNVMIQTDASSEDVTGARAEFRRLLVEQQTATITRTIREYSERINDNGVSASERTRVGELIRKQEERLRSLEDQAQQEALVENALRPKDSR